MAIRLFGRDATWHANRVSVSSNQADTLDPQAFQGPAYDAFNKIMNDNVRASAAEPELHHDEEPFSSPGLW